MDMLYFKRLRTLFSLSLYRQQKVDNRAAYSIQLKFTFKNRLKSYTLIMFIFVLTSSYLNKNSKLFSAFELFSTNPEYLAIGNISTFEKATKCSPIMLDENKFLRISYILPYGLTELSKESIETQIDLTGKKEKLLFISFETFGTDYEIYGEHSLFLAHNLFDTDLFQFTPSIALNILKLEEEYFYSGAINLSIYLNLFEEKFEMISSLNNLYATKIMEDKKISSLYVNLDMKYQFVPDFAFYVGLEKDDKYEIIIKNGLKYSMAPYIDLMAGYNFKPALITTGFNIRLFNRQLNFSNDFLFLIYLFLFHLKYCSLLIALDWSSRLQLSTLNP